MKAGIVGLMQAGKTSLFDLMTGGKKTVVGGTAKGVVQVPDPRVRWLSELYKPRKTTYATFEILEVPGLTAEQKAAGFLAGVRESDILVIVVRAFENPEVPHVFGEINPLQDLKLVLYELLLADLDLVEKRIKGLKEGKKGKFNKTEMELLFVLQDALEGEKPLSSLTFNEEEALLLANYQFLTLKPTVVVFNVGENETMKGREEVIPFCQEMDMPFLTLSLKLEKEIQDLPEQERELFLSELGITEPGIEVLSRVIYQKLGLISFFTVGEDEVKAWTIKKDTTAKKAAGKVHSDMEKGFIRAEVIDFASLQKAGNMQNARKEGLVRLEGKDYVVKDGDVVHFRFNI